MIQWVSDIPSLGRRERLAGSLSVGSEVLVCSTGGRDILIFNTQHKNNN